MSHRPALTVAALLGATALVAMLHLAIGSSLWLPTGDLLTELFRGPVPDGNDINRTLWLTRLPRVLAALTVGGILGLVGSAFQAQFRNPLAEPYVVGVASGAALGGVISMHLRLVEPFGTMGLGFVGGMASLALVWRLASRQGIVDVSTLLLAGVVVGALLTSLMSMGLLLAGHNTNQLIFWLMGHLHDATWTQIQVLSIALFGGGVVLVWQSKRLNAVALGEDTAARLGVDVGRLRLIVLTVGTAMTAVAVGAVGIIGFLGLVAPHIARHLLGVDWRRSLIGACILGAGLLVTADLLTMRSLNLLVNTVGLEPPVGFVTAILGAPSLLILLRKQS